MSGRAPDLSGRAPALSGRALPEWSRPLEKYTAEGSLSGRALSLSGRAPENDSNFLQIASFDLSLVFASSQMHNEAV